MKFKIIVVTFCIMLLISNMACSATSSKTPTPATTENKGMTVTSRSYDMSASSTVEAVGTTSTSSMTYSTLSTNSIMSNGVQAVSPTKSVTSTVTDNLTATTTPSLRSATKMTSKYVSPVPESKSSSFSSSSSAWNITSTSSMKYCPSSLIRNVNVTLRNDCEKLCCGNSLSNMYNVTLSCDNTVSKEVCECAAKKKNITLKQSSYESKPCEDCDCSSGNMLVASISLIMLAIVPVLQIV